VKSGRDIAAELLDAAPDTLRFDRAAFHASGGGSVTLTDMARHVAVNGMPTDPAMREWRAVADFTGRLPAHPTGAAVCELEVDPQTGVVELVHYTAIDDVGKPINPLIVEGQMHGGLAQGIGQALLEGYHVDPETGSVLSGSFMDYGVARSSAMPPLTLELTEDPTAGNPLGVKGGGESGITPATAAIFNALAHALREFGDEELPMPATAQAVWAFIHREDSAQAATAGAPSRYVGATA
jgi:carbon-monoxide dehydrogenase large subunit